MRLTKYLQIAAQTDNHMIISKGFGLIFLLLKFGYWHITSVIHFSL